MLITAEMESPLTDEEPARTPALPTIPTPLINVANYEAILGVDRLHSVNNLI